MSNPIQLVTIIFPEWQPAGVVRLVSTELGPRLLFPSTPAERGVYRFTIAGRPKVAKYAGRTRRTFPVRFSTGYSYRSTHPKLPLSDSNTTTRIARRMVHDIQAGMVVTVEVALCRAQRIWRSTSSSSISSTSST
jgi:hypothetical protein